MEHQQPDWRSGLPTGILGIVAKAGLERGNDWTKVMREVCPTWKEEFELVVTKLVIGEAGPLPLPSISIHFPNLTSLDIGRCYMDDAGLGALADLKKVACLTLGMSAIVQPQVGQLPKTLTASGLARVQHFPLTSLDLTWCENIDESVLESCLLEMPLIRLILERCQVRNTSFLQGLPSITDLNLGFCKLSWEDEVTGSPLEALAYLPLTRLNLEFCETLTPKGLGHVAGLPITDLDLSWCDGPYFNRDQNVMLVLRGMPLKRLVLEGWADALTDESLAHLRGLQLEQLDLRFTNISDAGLVHLHGMPLVSLSLSFTRNVSLGGMQHLRGLPLARLNVRFIWGNGFLYETVVGLVGEVLPSNCVVTKDDDFVV